VLVVTTKSFSKAARSAGVSQSTVSKQMSQLEKRLGVQLLRRTPRGFNLTDAGSAFYDSSVRLIADLEEAEQSVAVGHETPVGRIRVAISAAFGRLYILPHLAEFFARYPGVCVEFDISERFANLIENVVDVAIRIGNLSDSSLVAKRIGTIDFATAATPAYFEKHGTPVHPSDLNGMPAVVFNFEGAPRPWRFRDEGKELTVFPSPLVLSNDADYIRTAVLEGLGVAHNASWLFHDQIQAGTLRQVLHEFEPGTLPINALHASSKRLPTRVQVFVDFVAEKLAGHPHLRMR
jgi:LysR family transcriptional regulator for bpeEF and oprC